MASWIRGRPSWREGVTEPLSSVDDGGEDEEEDDDDDDDEVVGRAGRDGCVKVKRESGVGREWAMMG